MYQDLTYKIIKLAIRKVLKHVYGFTEEQTAHFIDAVILADKEIRTELGKRIKDPTEN